MRPSLVGFLALALAVATPTVSAAQHSHGAGGGMDHGSRRTEHEHPAPEQPPAGLLPLGSPRPIEVLVVYYGFSPVEILADQGEEVVLRMRRSDAGRCRDGLSIPSRGIVVPLPLGENVPVSLKLDRAETLTLQCLGDDSHASVVVVPRQVPSQGRPN